MNKQTVDWGEPVACTTLRRIHLRRVLRRRIDTGVGVIVLLLMAWLFPTGSLWILGGVLLIFLLVMLGTTVQQAQLGRVTAASESVAFRVGAQTLDANNALGDFPIPYSRIKRLIRDSEGLIVGYAAGSTLTSPNRPVKDALLTSFAQKEKSV